MKEYENSPNLDSEHENSNENLEDEMNKFKEEFYKFKTDTEEQIDYIIDKVHSVVQLYRNMSPYWEDLEKGVREHCIPEFMK